MSQWALVSGQALSLPVGMSLWWLRETCRPGARANSSVKIHRKLWEEDATCIRKAFHSHHTDGIRHKTRVQSWLSSLFSHLSYSAHLRWCTEAFPWWWRALTGCFESRHREFIYNQSGGSPVGAWWFLTSGQADVQRTWIKHTAHLTTERRLFWVSNEIWGMISIHKLKRKKKKSLLSDDCDAAWNMDAVHVAWPGWLSRVQLQLWQSKLRQVRQNVVNGREMNGRLITSLECTNRNIMWPLSPQVFTNRWNTMWAGAAIRCTPLSALHTFRFIKKLLSVYFSFFLRKGWAQQFSSTGGWEGDNRMRYHTAHSKLVPVLYLRWSSNHNHTRVWL